MTLPKITPPSMDKLVLWCTEATTVFLNGCISGLGGGTVAGASTGTVAIASSGTVQPNHLSVALATAALAAVGNGLKRVIVWHDTNPLPNPFIGDQQSSAPFAR
jgi:hypothetical protein